MANPFITQDPNNPDVLALARRQRMAESLLQQGQQPVEGQTVSGIYVAPSWTQHLAKGLQSYLGMKGMQDVEGQQKAMYENQRTQGAADMQRMSEALTGKPSETIASSGDYEGFAPTPAQTKAVAPNPSEAFNIAAQSQNPMLQQFGIQSMITNAESQAKLQQAMQQRKAQSDLWNATGGDIQKFQLAGGDPTFAKQMAEAPNLGKEKLINVNGQLMGELTGQKTGSVVPKQFDQPQAISEYEYAKNQGYKGSLQQFIIDQKRAGAANMSVSVAGPENKFNQDVGAGLAKDALAAVDAARSAPELVSNARSIKAAIDKGAITGSGADTRLALQKMMETAGMVGPGKAASTQELMSGLSKLTLGGIKSSGLGGGNGFTDKDREFLNSAIGGQISDTPENLRRVADLSERVALATHAKGSQVLSRWQQNPALKNVAQDMTIDPLPQVQGMPDPSAFAAEMARRGLK
jgi:hypothetical protein